MYTEENMERILSYFLSNKMQSNYVLEKNMLNDLPGIDKQDSQTASTLWRVEG